MTPRQREARSIVEAETVVTSKTVADKLSISTNYATQLLGALVSAGVADVRHGQGGTYEWTAR